MTTTLFAAKATMAKGVCLLTAGVMLAACQPADGERVAFDGIFFRSSASPADRKDRQAFDVSVRPFSASAEGAREAGRYEATRYCVSRYGTSDIVWTNGPDAEDGTLIVDNDRLMLSGQCSP